MAGMLSTIFRKQFTTSSRNLMAHGGGDSEGSIKLWRNLTYFVGLPAIGLCMLNAYLIYKEEDHSPQEFVPYEHMRIMTKRFPWGDGKHTLFHNPHVNALPTDHEDPHH